MRVNLAYVPVVHAGYISYFKNNPGRIYLIDPSLAPELSYLEREARALSPTVAAVLLRSVLGLDYTPEVIGVGNDALIGRLRKDAESIVMPDEDITHAIAEKYFSEKSVTFANAFLRWNWGNVTKDEMIVPDRIIPIKEMKEIVQRGQQEAEQSPDWWRQIGAVLIKDGVIIISAHNTHFPSEYSVSILGDPRTPFKFGERIEVTSAHHAEKEIICWAAKHGVATDGMEIFVTTFPCPNCAKDLVMAGIKRVYYQEGYSLLAAEEILHAHGIEVVKVT